MATVFDCLLVFSVIYSTRLHHYNSGPPLKPILNKLKSIFDFQSTLHSHIFELMYKDPNDFGVWIVLLCNFFMFFDLHPQLDLTVILPLCHILLIVC